MAAFEFKAGGHGIARFVYLFNYPEGVSVSDGEAWYLGEHVPQVKKLTGILRYRSWRALPPIPMPSPDPYDRFVRMSELAFENMVACRQATLANLRLWTPSSKGVPGFGELECVILDEEPQYDLLRDVPAEQYKYMALPLKYSGGAPELEDTEDTIIDVYMFNYGVPIADGEDWYLGHHVREGKLVKQVGVTHYQTWKTIRVPQEPNSPLRPNRFYRLTELGLPASAKEWPKEGDPPRPRLLFTMSQLGNVLGDWRNIVIDPEQVRDLLK